jgi:hypothetical protein
MGTGRGGRRRRRRWWWRRGVKTTMTTWKI